MTVTRADVPQTRQLPWGTTSERQFTREGLFVAAVMGTFAVFITMPLGVLGIVLSNTGLNRIRRGQHGGRFLMWSWICFVPGTVIGVPAAILLVRARS